jgi:hypothetical protein
LAGAEIAAALPMGLALSTPASAQFFPYYDDRPRYQYGPPPGMMLEPRAPPVDYSKAPSPRKPDVAPTTTIVVMGDPMADWLAYGLEDAFSDTPEIGIVRKSRATSGIIRYDSRNDMDWARAAREIFAAEKPSAVVMMLGLNDRQSIRDRAAVRGSPSPQAQPQTPDQQNQPTPEAADSPDTQVAAPEPQRASGSSFEFRSERWAEIYAKRIDETIAALKSKGVPVIWVGLAPVRGPKSMSDTAYLNDLYRAAAEKAGIIYVDVWDGFVDEGGKFATQGPDFEGQIRRLRTPDGAYFTKAGARKLAHYVERELRRVMATRLLPMALPADQSLQQPSTALRSGGPAARPLAGPVVPLTATAVSASEELLGSGGPRPSAGDPAATKVLINGEAVIPSQGRADDFGWPPRNAVAVQSEPEHSPAQPAALAAPQDVGKKTPAGKQTKDKAGQDGEQNPARKKPSREGPRPPARIGAASPFGVFR